MYNYFISRKGDGPLEHYFTNNPDLKSELREIPYILNGVNFNFFSDNGVFAKNKIDYASNLLVNSFLKQHEKNSLKTLLDVGCGYGFMGIVLAKILDYDVTLIDVNKRALHLCERNIKLNEIKGKAFLSDAYQNIDNKYDYIITNPPIRAGKETVMKILASAKDYLKEDGELWFVINKDQGAKSTKKTLEEWYNIEVVDKSKGFYCYKAKIC